MTESVLTRDRILDTAEEVLRRFGPAKATVVDVARALRVSHGSVYRHFPSKVALRDAVAERCLTRVSAPLGTIAAEPGPAPARLRRWLEQLNAAKRTMAREDPELFATYHQITADARAVVTAHLDTLTSHIERIITDGVEQGQFTNTDSAVSARAVLHATARFHHPAHASEWSDPRIDADFDGVWSLVLRGLGVVAAVPVGGARERRKPRSTVRRRPG
jgi:AcrR family transcriptional regulator